MTTAYSGDGITFPDNSVQATAPRVGMVNRIINGDMRIDQRNGGASVTSTTSNPYTLDRWQAIATVSSKYTIQQSSTASTGFTNSLLVTSSAATTVGSGDVYSMRQLVEGFNCADLGWGTANAQTVTLSFLVRSSLTGTFGGSFRNSASNRSYPFSYTVSAANTWEQKSVTVAGDTSGTWLTTNGAGISISFGLGVGSTYSGTAGSWAGADYASATGATSVVGTSGATFYITGVQLEKGSTATDFEYVDYGRQLQMCQRYFQAFTIATYSFAGATYSASDARATISFRSSMRTPPTSISTTGAISFATSAGVATGTIAFSNSSIDYVSVIASGATGLPAAGGACLLRSNVGPFDLQVGAEL